MKKIILLSSALFLLIFAGCKETPKKHFSLIPKPQQLEEQSGFFNLSAQTEIVTSNPVYKNDAAIFNQFLNELFGITLKISDQASGTSNKIFLKETDDTSMHPEGYVMNISEDNISIEGKKDGIFYALQTLKQLIPVQKSENLQIPCCKITDFPTYEWRGMHLDVCRHFFTVDEVKRYIDFLAMYKMNRFHWHLTDDQGWRIQIDKYPKLTSVGGYRRGTLIGHYTENDQKFDTIHYGGFYTKDQIRDVVQYAADRHIMVVPEIELPGHAVAAIAAYPQFSCKGGHFETERLWGVFDDVYCTKDETIAFLKDVLSEVVELFPGKYIHIGGDECPKVRWEKCPKCQAVKKREGLKTEAELQSYVVRQMDAFLTSKGKTLIGWDEILEGGLSPNAVVMSWRGWSGGREAAKQHHDVIICPGEYCYFDHYQGDPKTEPLAIGGYTTVGKVYSFNPMPDSLADEFKKYVIGAQANVWTEYISDFKKVEYMAIPRMSALSEVLWLPENKKDSNDFKARLIEHEKLLDVLKINYAKQKP